MANELQVPTSPSGTFDPFAGPQLSSATPSTEPQREIWTATQLGPEASLAFNESISLELRGPLDLEALRASLGDLVRRHESLRATFTPDGLTMCVLEDAPLPLELVDLAGLAGDAQAERRQSFLEREVETPFDLERGPLARVVLLRLAEDQHLLIFTGHHIVVDGWSWAVLISDWARLYTARRDGAAAALPPPDSWSEYASEQAAREHSPELRADEDYWLKQFAGELPVLDLPADRPRPSRRALRSRREDVRLDSTLVQALKRSGAREGASFFTTLLAAFKALVFRLTGQEDLVIGIPAAGQAASGRKALVGHCVNTLPLRTRIDAEQPFRTLLHDVRATMLDAFEHQQHTFGSLLRKLPLPRDPARMPLVSAVFNLDQAPGAEALAFAGLDVHFRSNPRHFETFDLFVNAVESPAGLMLECQYSCELFDPATVRRFASMYEQVLRAVAENPAVPVAELPLLLPEERERLLVAWNHTGVQDDPGDSIAEIVSEHARREPEAVALVMGTARMSYAELERRSNQLAHRLVAWGVAPDAPVGVCLERSFDLVVALLAILKAGGAYLPLEPNYPADRLAFMLGDSGAALVITQSSQQGVLPESGGRRFLLDRERETLERERPDPPAAARGRDALANVIYTSGSTGRPKGVLVTQRGVIRLVRGVDYARLGSDTVMAHWANLAFDASTWEIWGALLNGGRLVLHPESVPTGAGVAATIRDHGVNTALLTTALFNAIVDEDVLLFRGLRQLFVGGEALSVPHARRFVESLPEVELVNAYGPTEVSVITSTWRVRAPLAPELRAAPIGRPIRDTRVYVLDARRQPVPLGVVGELYVGGERLARGYHARPELTTERFLQSPFVPGERVYRTGDLVRYLADGSLEFVGRADGQVKLRGFRIELGEIEAALSAHPAVAQAAVIVREDRPGDRALVGYVVPQGDAAASDEELLAHLRSSLPKFMVPQQLVRLERMPLNPSGKLDRKALPAPERRGSGADYEPPRTPAETMLAGLWEKALGLPRLGRNDDFFALGGHSLLAAQVLSRLNREHGVVVPFRTIFEAPTIAQFAAAIEARSDAGAPASATPIPRRPDGPGVVSLMQERILLLEELDPERRYVHNVPSVFRLEGPLDEAALALALDDVVRRQENLRSTFRKEGGAYRQHVLPEVRVPFERRDLRALPEAERERQARELLREESARPFDIERGPLLRAFLLRLRDSEYYLFTLRHNTVWDGWSFDVFRHELASFYAERVGLGAAALPELPVRYSDFAAWHREWLEGPEAHRQAEFWRKQLAGHPGPVELPTDRPRRAERDYQGANEWIEIPRAEADAVAELGQKLGATSFMVLLAALDVLLHRYTGQRDLLVACPVRNRPRPEIEDLAGLFTNTLMLRSRVDPAMSFAALVKSVRATTLDAFSHQELPFERLASDAPPVRVLFSLQEGRHRETSLGPVKLSLPHLVVPAIAVDMNFWFVEMKHGLAGALNYSTQLFDAGTIRRFVAHYRSLLRAALADPGQPVGRMALAAPDEPVSRLASPAGAGAADEPASLFAMLPEPAADDTAEPGGGRDSASLRTLAAAAVRAAAWLRTRGVTPGERVGVALTGTDRVAALLGIARHGAIAVPLDPAEPQARLSARQQAASATWLWADPELLDGCELDDARRLSTQDLAATTDPAVEHVAHARGAAWIATTFGADGVCSATEVPWRSVLLRLREAANRLALPPERALVVTSSAPPFVSLLPVVAGARVVVASDEDAEDGASLLALLEREQAAGLVAPPAVFRRLLAEGWRGGPGFTAVVGEPPRADLLEKLLATGSSLFAAWGAEEAGDWCGLGVLAAAEDGSMLGELLPGLEASVIGPSGGLVPIGVPGELEVRCAAGEGEPPAVAVAIGERVRQKADGRLERLARAGSRVRVLGKPVEPAEVRARLLEHEAVADAEVVLREDAPGEPRLVAYVVPAAGAAFTDTELRRHLRRSLGAEATPQHVVTVERLARRPDGLLDLKLVPTPFASSRGAARPPRSEEEKLVLALCAEALGLAQVGLGDNFFDLGGHSLLGLQLVSRIEVQTGRRLKPRLLLLSTLEQVAAELSQAQPSPR